MFTVSLIANPTGVPIEPAAAEALRNAWGGGAVDWLHPDRAAEFPVPTLPDNRWDVWQEFQAMGVDLAVQTTQGRRKKMLLADMDSTLIQQECIDELADEAGVGAHVADITARAMNGELEFEAALRERVGLLRDLPVQVIDQVMKDRISLMPGADVLVATMKAMGGYCALVSGGFTSFSARVAERLGMDEHRANVLDIVDGRLAGTVQSPIMGRDAKVSALQEISGRLGLTPGDVIAVGDGANDLGMLGLAGTGVALHAKPAVAAQCDVRINHGDLTALLYLQGVSSDDFRTGQRASLT